MNGMESLNNGQYQVLRSLPTKTSFGEYSLVKNESNQNFSLKMINILSQDEINKGINDIESLKRLNNENLIKFMHYFSDNNRTCLVFEFLQDGTLDDLILHYKENNKLFKEEQIFEWTIQLMNGLAAIHSQNIIHRDICPANVYLQFNKLKLGCIGLARTIESIKKSPNIDNLFYVSPEVVANKNFDPKSDIWSTGCVIYELASLKKIFTGKNQKEIFHSIQNDQVPELENSDIIRPIINRMMHRKLQNRCSSSELLEKVKIIYQRKKDSDRRIVLEVLGEDIKQITFNKHYKLVKKLGNKKNASLYLVEDTQKSNMRRVLKMSETSMADNEMDRLRKEADNLKRLKAESEKYPDSNYVVSIIEQFTENGAFCILTEYFEDGDLEKTIQSYVDSKKKFDVESIRNIIIQLMSGLKFLHENDVIHRNIKPSNLFWKGNVIKIGDLGMAVSTQSILASFTKNQSFNYIAPEVIDQNKQDITPAIDIWSAGCVLYEVIMLRKAFNGTGPQEVQNNIINLEPTIELSKFSNDKNYRFYVTVDEMLKNILLKNPGRRWQPVDILNRIQSTRSI